VLGEANEKGDAVGAGEEEVEPANNSIRFDLA